MGKRKSDPTEENIGIEEIIQPNVEEPKKKKKGKSKKKSENEGADKNKTLFELIKQGAATKLVQDEWYKRYPTSKKEKFEVLAEMLNFLIESCGCRSTVLTAQKLQHDDVPTLMKEIVSNKYLQESDSDYPVVSRKPEFKNFVENFLNFWNKFFAKCPNSILLDDIFGDALSSWLSNLTNSSARPVRHTATFVGLETISGLITAAKRLHHQQQQTQKQLATEHKKSSSTPKAKQLTEMVDRNQEVITRIEEIMDELFLGVFFRRYRDTVPEIRVACIEALGSWINEYPKHFLEDEYLKFIAWTLNDKVPDVRKASLAALQPLYENREYQPQLEHFTERFKERLLEMTADIDTQVCVQALKLASKLQQQHLLEQSDIDSISLLVTNEHANVRHEAANFVKHLVFEEEEHASAKKAKKVEKPEAQAQEQLCKFLELVNESKIPDLPNYITDAMWNTSDFLRNWSAMTELLLEDDKLDDRNQTTLVKLINVCIQRASGKSICPKTRHESADKNPKKGKATLLANQENLTKHFIKVLPQLLQKFKTEKELVEELVEIPQYFLLDIYSQRHKHQFNDLLQILSEIYCKDTEDSILHKVAKTFKYYVSQEKCIFHAEVKQKMTELWDELVKKFEESLENEDEDAQAVHLTRVYKFMNVLQPQTDLMDTVKGILKDSTSPSLVMAAMDYTLSHLMWKFYALNQNSSDISSLKPDLDEFKKALEVLLANENDLVQRKAFTMLSNLLLLFTQKMKNTVFDELVFEPSLKLQKAMASYVRTALMNEDEEERDNIISAVSRLLAYGCIMGEIIAPVVVAEYTGSTKLGDGVIRSMLQKMRERAPREEGKLVFQALQLIFERQYEDLEKHIKELNTFAKHLAATYSSTAENDNFALEQLFKESATYFAANVAERVKFVGSGLIEFASKLPSTAASEFKDLYSPYGEQLNQHDDEDKPFFNFMEQLGTMADLKKKRSKKARVDRNILEELDENESDTNKLSSTKPKRKSSKKSYESDVPSGNEVEDIEESQPQQEKKSASKGRARPAMQRIVASDEEPENEDVLLETSALGKTSSSLAKRKASHEPADEEDVSPKTKIKK